MITKDCANEDTEGLLSSMQMDEADEMMMNELEESLSSNHTELSASQTVTKMGGEIPLCKIGRRSSSVHFVRRLRLCGEGLQVSRFDHSDL